MSDFLKNPESENGIPHSGISVDAEANWFHEEIQIIREDILDLFYQNLDEIESGRYVIVWQGQSHLLEVADTPYVIVRVDRETTEEGRDVIRLTLKHRPKPEQLQPDTIEIGSDNVLYCRIQDGRFRARFSRPAYYQLAEWIEEEKGKGEYYIELNGKHYPIRSA